MATKRTTLLAAAVSTLLLLGACAHGAPKPSTVPDSLLAADLLTKNYDQRTWYPPAEVSFDPIAVGEAATVLMKSARTKIIGPSYDDAVRSLATKLWLIDHARYTVDLVYYIFKRDTVGYAVLGALCNAVQRGVDVRLMVDSAGSMHPTHSELDALLTCADDAGFVLDEAGRPTNRRARVQVVVVNAISKVFVRINRRSHDKLLVVDGHVRDRAVVMTGGRNISVSYYGLRDDGSPDPTAFQDMEILLRPGPVDGVEPMSVGEAALYYHSLLFLNPGNKRLEPPSPGAGARGHHAAERRKAQERLERVRSLPGVQAATAEMPAFLDEGFSLSQVRLAHELGNLHRRRAVRGIGQHLERNVNSIQTLLGNAREAAPPKRLRIVSPYLFVARYTDDRGETSYDGAKWFLELLADHPEATVEIITNSALTSDNFLAQSVIDMDTAPRLLLSDDLARRWRQGLRRGELDRKLVESEEWKRLVANPRLRVYQTGRLDATELGGAAAYGKLHAKFILADGGGFVGTDNFDYRSRLFNNEFGYYFQGEELSEALGREFDRLKAKSYLWGSPEWLELRRSLMQQKGTKARTTRWQRWMYKLSKRTGLIWLY